MQTHCTLNLKSLHFICESRDREMLFFSLYHCRERKIERLSPRSSHNSGFSVCIRSGTVGCRIEYRAEHYWAPSSSLHLLRKHKKNLLFFQSRKMCYSTFDSRSGLGGKRWKIFSLFIWVFHEKTVFHLCCDYVSILRVIGHRRTSWVWIIYRYLRFNSLA